jgi:16S rRNA (guanine527-N7)-methyltransferase
MAQSILVKAGLKTTLCAEQVERIAEFLRLRQEWHKTHNLMGPKAADNPWQIDVCDAVALLEIHDNDLPLYDVGSGSGVPGLILGLLCPDATICLVEPLSKRAAFLKTALHRFKLANVVVKRARWPLPEVEPCQVISRAVVSPETWPSLACSSPEVKRIYRYLALNRPPFSVPEFQLARSCDYSRTDVESLRLEQWVRMT